MWWLYCVVSRVSERNEGRKIQQTFTKYHLIVSRKIETFLCVKALTKERLIFETIHKFIAYRRHEVKRNKNGNYVPGK